MRHGTLAYRSRHVLPRSIAWWNHYMAWRICWLPHSVPNQYPAYTQQVQQVTVGDEEGRCCAVATTAMRTEGNGARGGSCCYGMHTYNALPVYGTNTQPFESSGKRGHPQLILR